MNASPLFTPVTPDRMRLRQIPMAAAALCFALGIVQDHFERSRAVFGSTPHLLLAIFLFSMLLLVARRMRFIAWAPLAGLWIALGMAALAWQPSPPIPVDLLHYADNLSRSTEGIVIRVRKPPPAPVADGTDADSVPAWEATEDAPAAGLRAAPLLVDLAVDSVEDVTPDVSSMVPVTGGVRVAVYQAEGLDLHCGDRLQVPLRLKLPERFRDPGAFEYGDLLAAQGITLQSNVAGGRVTLLTGSRATLRCRVFAAQAWASARFVGFADSASNRRLPPALRLTRADVEMLNAMLFGDRSGLTHPLRVGFERTGSFHLFVVSGLHIALLAAGVFWILLRLRAPDWLATLLTLVAAFAYTALTGFGQPAQRSLVMTSAYLVARLLSRDRDSLNALGAAVLALLVWAPSSLFDASFQMTVLAIVAIGGIAVPLARRTPLRLRRVAEDVFRRPRAVFVPHDAQLRLTLETWGEACGALLGKWSRRLPAQLFRAALWAGELALIATVAELVMVLPMAEWFHRAALFALPANMVVIPVIAVLAPAAIATFLCSLVNPWLAAVPGALTAALLHAVTWTIHRLSHLAVADIRIPGPAPWVAIAAVLAWLLCCWSVRRSRLGAFATALALPLIAVAVLWPEPVLRTPATLEITAIDVGQGDSLLAVDPDGSAMLIDAGGPTGRNGNAETVSPFDLGENVVAPYLWSRRFRRLDIVVLSHAHTDHMGGMPAILEAFRPRELWVGADPQSPLYANLLAEASRLGTVVRHLHAGDRPAWGRVAVTVLAPEPAYRNAGPPRNDDSLVLRMQYGKASALLEGDAETPSEQAMLAAGRVEPVTLLKVSHHGSRTSTTAEFLAAAAPEDAVISVGRGNTFGHPRPEIIARLAAAHSRVFRTDRFGLSTFLLSSDGSIRESVNDTPLPAHAPH